MISIHLQPSVLKMKRGRLEQCEVKGEKTAVCLPPPPPKLTEFILQGRGEPECYEYAPPVYCILLNI